MPQWTSGAGVPLGAGCKLAVLNAESLANNAAAEAVYLNSASRNATLGIVNQTAQTVTLQASGDGVNFVTVYSGGAAVTVPTNEAAFFNVSSGLFYRLANLSGTGIVTQTLWMAL